MSIITLPYVFVGGTRAIADQVNADFNAVANAVNTNVRTTLTTPTTFYVAPSGADLPGNGLSPASPAATVNYILTLLHSYDFGNQRVTIQLADGSYTEAVLCFGTMLGQTAANQLVIQGNTNAPNLVTWTGDPNGIVPGVCFTIGDGGLAAIQGVTMISASSQCIYASAGGRMIFSDVIFGATQFFQLFASRGGEIEAVGNYTISGSAQAHVVAGEGGRVWIARGPGNGTDFAPGVPTVNLTGTPNFSLAFAMSNDLAVIKIGAVFTGTGATGVRSQTNNNGVINIQGQGTTYLPGNLPGVNNTGGQTN